MVLSERLDAGFELSSRTLTFATAWCGDFNMLNEVIGIIEKIAYPTGSRVHAYDMLIAALCKRDRVNAALRVLEKMVNAGHAPKPTTFLPFIASYRRTNQMDMVQEIHETMEIFHCLPIKI